MEKGTITIRKFSRAYKFEDNALYFRRGKPEENAAFEIRAAEDIYVVDKCVYKKNDPVCEWLVTDHLGIVETESLPYGRYNLYDLAHPDAAPKPVMLAESNTFVAIDDEPELGTVKIINNSGSNTVPRIFSADGKPALSLPVEDSAVLGYVEMFPEGIYSVEIEDNPAAYFRIDNNCAEIEIKEHGFLIRMKEKEVSGKEFVLFKKDENGKPVMGAMYGLISANGINMKFSASDKNGEVKFTGLKNGMYIINELEAADGFEIDENTVAVSIDDSWVNQSDRVASGENPDNVYITSIAKSIEAEYSYDEELEM